MTMSIRSRVFLGHLALLLIGTVFGYSLLLR